METGVTQDNHAPVDLANKPLKRLVRHIRSGTLPPHHQAILVQQQTEFPADNPAMVRQAFATNLLGAAAFADGVYELNPIGIDNPQHRCGGPEGLRPVLMGPEEAKEAGALGEAGKQRPIVARQPANWL